MRRACTVIMAIGLLGGLCWVFGIGTPGWFNLPTHFSSSRWKATTGWHKTRCSMIADLRRRVILTGRTQHEVVNLLGSPDMQMDGSRSTYLLCQSLGDIYVLELAWQRGRVASVGVREL